MRCHRAAHSGRAARITQSNVMPLCRNFAP
jgi:hypothetical protein